MRASHLDRILLLAAALLSACSFPPPIVRPKSPPSTQPIAVAATEPTTAPTTAPASVLGFPQTTDPRDTIPFLASDALAGRAPGTAGIERAADFLCDEYHRIGLIPAPGLADYSQPFPMQLGAAVTEATRLSINDKPLQINTDFSPLSLSGEGSFSGAVVFAGYGVSQNAGGYDDYANLDVHGKIVLAMRQEPRDAQGKSRIAEAGHQWSDAAYFNHKAQTAAAHGAAALLLVTPPSIPSADDVIAFSSQGNGASAIPVIHITRRVANLLLDAGACPDLLQLQQAIDGSGVPHSQPLNDVEVAGDVSLKHTTAKVRNMVGILPGAGPHTDEFIVVGAHYDHLGIGQLGHAIGSAHSIYHGADDNASGTAALLELAERIKNGPPPPRSLMFICFTGEEEGLIGSDWFVKHPPIPLENVVAMLNLDMVGRLKDQTLLVGGWGTAPAFDDLLNQSLAGLTLHRQSFEKGGLGPSDHMSFALKKIPVLFLFTGLHADYHRPTDTADKINYAGIDEVVEAAQRVIGALLVMPRQTYDGSSDGKSTMAFVSGHGDGSRASLGIIPDFGASDSTAGVPISGVGEGTPAQLAGLKGGDVITRFNDKPMNNLQDLSEALAQANPGDAVAVIIRRDGRELTVHAVLAVRKSE